MLFRVRFSPLLLPPGVPARCVYAAAVRQTSPGAHPLALLLTGLNCCPAYVVTSVNVSKVVVTEFARNPFACRRLLDKTLVGDGLSGLKTASQARPEGPA